MILKVFTIRDAKGGFYNTPFYCHTHGEAERSFKMTISNDDPKNMVKQFPEDFDLYYIGEYDNVAGTYQCLETPQHVVKAVQVLQQQ